MVIVDPKKRKSLKSVAAVASDKKDNTNSYVQKYRELVYFNKIGKDLNKLIEKFLDGELTHFYQSEKVKQATRVQKVCSTNFEQEVLKGKAPTEESFCIVEVFKHDCPSCNFNGKVFNAFSRKLEKHGFLDKLPCYRLSIENKVPFLGNFGYSPIYLFVRKRGE